MPLITQIVLYLDSFFSFAAVVLNLINLLIFGVPGHENDDVFVDFFYRLTTHTILLKSHPALILYLAFIPAVNNHEAAFSFNSSFSQNWVFQFTIRFAMFG